jgi:hypothetical protein
LDRLDQFECALLFWIGDCGDVECWGIRAGIGCAASIAHDGAEYIQECRKAMRWCSVTELAACDFDFGCLGIFWRVRRDRGSSWRPGLDRRTSVRAKLRAYAIQRSRRAYIEGYALAPCPPDGDGSGGSSDRSFSRNGTHALHGRAICNCGRNRRCSSDPWKLKGWRL